MSVGFMLLQIFERKPPSLAAVIGIVLSMVGVLFTILRYKMDIRKARKDMQKESQAELAKRDAALEQMVKAACDAYLVSAEFNEKRDQRVRELMAIATRDALDKYGPSFASKESSDAIDKRFGRLEEHVRRIESFLASRVTFKMSDGK